jgi:hypothetical protein
MRVCVRVRRRDTAPDPRTPGGRGVSRVSTHIAFPRSCACFSGSAPPAPRSSCPTLLRPVLSRIGDSELGLGGQLSGLINT